jgi:short-subunit dehydrogenase
MTSRPFAVVTGASGGIGAEFARQLAPDHDLLLVARSETRLAEVQSSLQVHGGDVTFVVADLSTSAGVRSVVDHVRGSSRTVELLVNNAGSGKHGSFVDTSPDDVAQQVTLDVGAVVVLTRAFLPAMVAAGRGGVINVGSTAGFQPTPRLATYAAAKAFVVSFSEALSVEVRGTGVTVSVVAPGTVDTGFFTAAGASFRAGGLLSASAVVTAALAGHRAGRSLIVPGLANKLSTLGARVLPRSVMARVAGWVARPR